MAAERVFCHIGLPKTGTTFLQDVLWGAREQARADGLLLPGRERRDHLWSSRILRGEDFPAHETDKQRAWDRVRGDLADWSGTGLLTHEFFAAASAEQARRLVADLAPAEVHVVVTAREPLGLFTTSWQESLKNRDTTRLDAYARTESADPRVIWNWRTLDLRLVLQRWLEAVPADRVHVLPLPTGEQPRSVLWQQFAGVVGLDPTAYDVGEEAANQTMGVVEAETLRRVNAHLTEFHRAFDRGVYIRTHLAHGHLVPRGGEPFWPGPEQVADARRRGEETVSFLQHSGVRVYGDPDTLRVPDPLPPRRTVDSVTDAEVADVSAAVVAGLLGDVRRLRDEVAQLRASGSPAREVAPAPPRWRRLARRVRDRVSRTGRRAS